MINYQNYNHESNLLKIQSQIDKIKLNDKEKKVEKMETNTIDDEFIQKAKTLGFEKKNILTDAKIAYRTYIFMFVGLLISDTIIFLGNISFPLDANGIAHWYVQPTAWQAYIITVLKDFGTIVIGKINNYHESQKEQMKQEMLITNLTKNVITTTVPLIEKSMQKSDIAEKNSTTT